jgi:hypothetical protein
MEGITGPFLEWPPVGQRRVRKVGELLFPLLLPYPMHQRHKIVRIGKRHLPRLSRPTNPDFDRPDFLVGVLARVHRLADIGPGRLDAAGRIGWDTSCSSGLRRWPLPYFSRPLWGSACRRRWIFLGIGPSSTGQSASLRQSVSSDVHCAGAPAALIAFESHAKPWLV